MRLYIKYAMILLSVSWFAWAVPRYIEQIVWLWSGG